MSLSADGLLSAMNAELEKNGFKPTSTNKKYNKTLASAIIKHIKENAQVIVPSGSSAGTYKVS